MRTTILTIACGIAVFVAGAGFLFGQAFSGIFSLTDSLAGVAGVLAGLLGWRQSANPRVKRFIAACCAVALIGVALDAFRYYSELQRAGNYYPWVLVGPFIASIVLIGYVALTPSPSASSRRGALGP